MIPLSFLPQGCRASSLRSRRRHHAPPGLLVFALLAVCGAAPTARAQLLAAEVRVNLNPAEFNLQALQPAPPASAVFAGGAGNYVPIYIRQWTNNTMTVGVTSRTQTIGQSAGASSTTTGSLSISASAGDVGASAGTSTAVTSSTTINTSIQNSLSFRTEGNVLIAVAQYTVNGVVYTTEISLGTVTWEGGFQQFSAGHLAGKVVVGDPPGGTPATNVSGNAPGTTTVGGRTYRGFVNSGASSLYANVLKGYWVTVSRVGGRVVDVKVEGVYEMRYVGFARSAAPITWPGGVEPPR